MKPRDLSTYRSPGGEPEIVRELEAERETGEKKVDGPPAGNVRSDDAYQSDHPVPQTRPEDQEDA